MVVTLNTTDITDYWNPQPPSGLFSKANVYSEEGKLDYSKRVRYL